MTALLVAKVHCPKCRKAAPFRVFPKMRRLTEGMEPDTPLQTLKCKCGEIYLVTAEAYQDAR